MAPLSEDIPRSGRRARWVVLGILALVLGGTVYWINRSPSSVPTIATNKTNHTIELAANPAGYVGPKACAACHADRVAECALTGHFRTCREPDPQSMPAGFSPSQGKLTSHYPGLRFEMSRLGDQFYQTTIRSTPEGEQLTRSRIDLVLGAGTADDVYLSWRGDDRMYELPMAWIHSLNCWGLSHFDPNALGDSARPLTPRCLECHNTWFDYVPGSVNQYRRSQYLLGVTCERCHGPGRDHVAFHRSHPEAQTPHAIVQPAKLNRELQLDVCTQCHGNAMTHKGPTFAYQPGQPLSSHYRTVSSQNNEEDHVANQIQYLRQSKCFQNDESMTCTTCHDPHRKRDSANAGSTSCRKCHEPQACTDRDHLPVKVRNKCAECHMPLYVKINVNFHTADDNYVPPIRRYDHRIAIHPAARSEVLLNWYRTQSDEPSRVEAARLTRELTDYWLADAEKCQREFRYVGVIAALREAIRFDDSEETREKLRAAVALQTQYDDDWIQATYHFSHNQPTQAIELLTKIIALKPDDALAHGRLGTLYAQTGQKKKAIEHLEAVAKHDPDSPYGHGMLGWLAYLEGRPAEAVEHYLRAEEVEPYDAKINFHMGLALARLDRLPEAAERFRKALTIEPNRPDICQQLVIVLRQQGQLKEAVDVTETAAKLTGYRNLNILMSLAESYAEIGEFGKAAETADTAMKVASKEDAPRVPEIRRQIETYRAKSTSPARRDPPQ